MSNGIATHDTQRVSLGGSQLSGFNDKSVFSRLLEEILKPESSDALIGQRAEDSCELIQVIVKAGLSFTKHQNGDVSRDTHDLVSNSLLAITLAIEKSPGALTLGVHSENVSKEGSQSLSMWLLKKLFGLFSGQAVENAFQSICQVICGILKGLRRLPSSYTEYQLAISFLLSHEVPRALKASSHLFSVLGSLSCLANVIADQEQLEHLGSPKALAQVLCDRNLVVAKIPLESATTEAVRGFVMGIILQVIADLCKATKVLTPPLALLISSALTMQLALVSNESSIIFLDHVVLVDNVDPSDMKNWKNNIYRVILGLNKDHCFEDFSEHTNLLKLLRRLDDLKCLPPVLQCRIRQPSGELNSSYLENSPKHIAAIFKKRKIDQASVHPLSDAIAVTFAIDIDDVDKMLSILIEKMQTMPVETQIRLIDFLGMTACASNGHAKLDIEGNEWTMRCELCCSSTYDDLLPALSIDQRVLEELCEKILQHEILWADDRKTIAILRSIKKIKSHSHITTSYDLTKTRIAKLLISSIKGESRMLRILAGQVLATYFIYAPVEELEQIASSNRRGIFEILTKSSFKPSLADTCLRTWAEIGKVARVEDLQIVLLKFIEHLCNPNVLVRHSTVTAIHKLAMALSTTPWSLFSPYLRQISVQIIMLSTAHPQLLTTFSNLIGISTSDFLARNQSFILPRLVLNGDASSIQKVSSASMRSVNKLLFDNIHCILSLLLTSGSNKDQLIRYLAQVDSKFANLNIDDLIRSVPIPLCSELLQMYAEESVRRATITAALSSVAYISMKPSSSTRKTPKDVAQETLRSFLEKHSLGIVGQFSEFINGFRGKRGVPEKIRYITAISELITHLGEQIEDAVPQITACLQTAMEETDLRPSALAAWDALICTVSETVVAPLIHHSFCLFMNIWPNCSTTDKLIMRNVIETFLDEHATILSKNIGLVPILKYPEIQDLEKRLSSLRSTSSLPIRLKNLIQLVESDNPAICEEGLKEMQSTIRDKQAELHAIVLREWSDSVVHETIRILLDVIVKFSTAREDIQVLAADCLGAIGAIDPVRQDAARKVSREVILHNFEDKDAEESVKFVRILLESRLVGAFKTATNSNVQIFLAWAIQELLKFSGLDGNALGGKSEYDRGNRLPDLEAIRRWRKFSPAARETMTPLLRSRWEVPEKASKVEVHYPIIKHAPNYRAWLFAFLFDLLKSGIGENARKLFNVFARILREEETVISVFLLPYVFLNVTIGCTEEKRAQLLLEITQVLEGDDKDADSFAQEYTRLAREAVFSILDYLSHWTRSRKIWNRDQLAEKMKRQNRQLHPEDEDDKDQSIKQVQWLSSQIPAALMARAALTCGSHSRALFYWEQHLRTEESVHGKTKRELEPLYAQLQELYMNINDPDGIEGVAASLHTLSLEQEIMMHENAGRWTAAQSSYEIALQARPQSEVVHIGLLNCMKQTGHYEVLLGQASKLVLNETSHSQAVLDIAVESSWYLEKWDVTHKLLACNKNKTYDTLLAASLLHLKEGDADLYQRTVTELRARVTTDLASSNVDSTWQCYDYLAKLSMVHELDCIAFDAATNKVQAYSPSVLQGRLNIMPSTSKWKQQILALRRAVITLCSHRNARSISSLWLQSAKLARKSGQAQQSYKAILNALNLKVLPLAEIEHARWWWNEGHQMRAIQTLRKSIDSKVFDDYQPDPNSILSIDMSMSTTGKTPKEALISKAELLLTRWNDLAENANSKQQLKEYSTASRGSQLEKPHYFMGKYYLRLLENEAKKSAELQDKDYVMGEYHRQVVMSYGRAMHFGVKYIFQTLPSYLQLWLDFGDQVKFVHPKSGNTQKRQELLQARASHLSSMNEKIKGFITRLPTYLYMLAFPQILSRINHLEKTCYSLLETMISKCLSDYPRQSLWPFMAVCKSRDGTRSGRGHTLIARIRSEAKKSSNTSLVRLTNEAQNLTDQLMHICTVPVIKNRSSLSLTRDFEFNSACLPSNLVVPIQANLTTVLPAQGGVGSTKHHRAFEDSQPTIVSFNDEVDIMSSLQKPRKITVRASDGQSYPFLVKPNDDLRKDARLMDFNGVIQKFIQRDPEATKRTLKIRTYAVIALNEDHGLCEWVRNTRPFRDIVIKTYSARNIPMNYGEVKTRLENCLTSQNPGQAFERHIVSSFPPTFHDWFVEKFADPSQWFAARLSYSRTLAVMSMVGFVLGLGDRHGENILFDETTGDAVHVDFNCLFEKGHTFDKPERVPFRLTHNLVDALGVTGVEGSFRKTCEITLRILRLNQDAFNTVLESFLHDPVGEFLKKVKKSASGDLEREEAKKVLSVIANKLKGSAGAGIADKHIPLSIEGQADELIKQATDNKLLVQMYIGWTAWL